jgi:hypothetical protein
MVVGSSRYNLFSFPSHPAVPRGTQIGTGHGPFIQLSVPVKSALCWTRTGANPEGRAESLMSRASGRCRPGYSGKQISNVYFPTILSYTNIRGCYVFNRQFFRNLHIRPRLPRLLLQRVRGGIHVGLQIATALPHLRIQRYPVTLNVLTPASPLSAASLKSGPCSRVFLIYPVKQIFGSRSSRPFLSYLSEIYCR